MITCLYKGQHSFIEMVKKGIMLCNFVGSHFSVQLASMNESAD